MSLNNSELPIQDTRSDSIERVANARSTQLSQLQTATDAIMASAIDTQRKFGDAQEELSRVRYDVLGAKTALQDVMNKKTDLETDFASQSDKGADIDRVTWITCSTSEPMFPAYARWGDS